jgi:hypothetical protein
MARSAKLSRPVAILWANVENAGIVSIEISIVIIPDIPMLNAIGTPIARNITKDSTRIRTSINNLV